MLRSFCALSRSVAGRSGCRGNSKPKSKDQLCWPSAGHAGFTDPSKMSQQRCSSGDHDYENAVKQLYRLQSNAEAIMKARQQKDKTLNIPNMVKYLQRSGLSMEDVDKLGVIHVSGTKGKGSTCAFCERIIHAHGYKTGLFSSPHLIEVRERIRINGRPIEKQIFSNYFWKVYNRLNLSQTSGGPEDGCGMPAYFAFLTILSVHIFLSEGVDVAIMEVGIGGQYDSTNFFRTPVVCGMTSLGLDHTAMLGNTIDKIAWNKAGIFKRGRPAVTVEHKPEAMSVVLDRAKEIQSPVCVSTPLSRATLARYNIQLGIAGEKQVENASLAVQLFRAWEKERSRDTISDDWSNPNDIQSPDEIPRLESAELDEPTVKGIGEGLCSCVWPGRAQTIRRPALTYYLDGAHTLESIEVCSSWFKKEADREVSSVKGRVARILIFNITGDRDAEALLSCLQECDFDAAVFCTNQVSVLDSYNKADQLNKTISSQAM
ncbi:folylpolyglutamate synthase, mitochondrial, partial [Aplysia californica]|uniref:Folylpolyglutamate synthase n=1 Tax=Aplysia californica TaxID=6500 RepID=A0ABM1AAN3_APLCA